MASSRWERIQSHCKIIWGRDRSYDITDEDVGDGNYLMVVREDRGTSFGNALTSVMIKGYDRAWDELEKLVAGMANAVETEGWVPKVQPLDVEAYPSMMHQFNANLETVRRLRSKIRDQGLDDKK